MTDITLSTDRWQLLKSIRERKISPHAAIGLLNAAQGSIPPVQAPVAIGVDAESGAADGPWEQHFLHDLTGIVAQILKLERREVDIDAPVSGMGLDSLSATEFNNHIRLKFGISLAATVFFECDSLRDFYQHMVNVHSGKLAGQYSASATAPRTDGLRVAAQAPVISSSQSATTQAPPAVMKSQSDPILTTLGRIWQRAASEIEETYTPRLTRILVSCEHRPKVEVCVAGKGPPILLLGGLLNPEGIWHKQLPALSSRYRAIAFNKPGCGSSEVDVRQLHPQAIVENLLSMLDAVGICVPIHVVGFSFGGLLAQTLATRSPERVSKMVLINTTACSRPRPEDVQILKNEVASCPDVIRINGEVDFSLAACYRDAVRNFDARPALPAVSTPTLVLAAAGDSYMKAEYGQELAGLLKNATFSAIANAGHFSLLTHADEINQRILNFLEQR